MEKQYKKRNWIKGSAKEHTGANYSLISLDLHLAELQNLPVNDAGYIKLTLSKNNEPDKFGNTHAIFENDFKPTKGGGSFKPKKKSSDDMPF